MRLHGPLTLFALLLSTAPVAAQPADGTVEEAPGGATSADTDSSEAAGGESAGADDVDALWALYDEQATRFETLQPECDAGDRSTTRVNRICREAADVSLALADTIERLLDVDDQLSDGDRALLVDGMLTNRQIAGALWVDLGECESGRLVLTALRDAPGIDERPVVMQATTTWIERADECLQAEAASEVARSRTGPIVLLSSGLTVLAAGVAWDLAETGNRDEFERLRDRCQDGCESDDFDRLNETKDALDRAKAPIAVLYGAGAAAAVSAVVWLAVRGRDRDDADPEVSLAPRLGPDGPGASLTVRW